MRIDAPFAVRVGLGVKLEQSGEYRIAASREEVWAALNDPEVLGACIAGCEEINKVDDHHFDVAVKAKVGPVSATFKAELELADLNPPASYAINGNAKGGAAGFARGSARVTLDEEGPGTVLRYTVNANVGGKLAQVGSRLIDGAARKMADDFFGEFSRRLDPQAQAQAQAQEVAGGDSSAAYEKSGHGLIWAIAFAVLVFAIVVAI